jgi:hypothetical protein
MISSSNSSGGGGSGNTSISNSSRNSCRSSKSCRSSSSISGSVGDSIVSQGNRSWAFRSCSSQRSNSSFDTHSEVTIHDSKKRKRNIPYIPNYHKNRLTRAANPQEADLYRRSHSSKCTNQSSYYFDQASTRDWYHHTSIHHTSSSSSSSSSSRDRKSKRDSWFTDLPLEWWEREEDCKEAKILHMLKLVL